MQDMEWKYLANNASKLYNGTEKEGIGKFLYKLRPEVSYAQLSSQLGAIFYHSKVWKWNEQKRGMKFLLLSQDWQQKTMQYYLFSLNLENEIVSLNNLSKHKKIETEGQEEKDKMSPRIGQTRLSIFLIIKQCDNL